jgi:hypothetical protein
MNFKNIIINFMQQELKFSEENKQIRYVVINTNTRTFLIDKMITYSKMSHEDLKESARFHGYKVLIDDSLEDGEVQVVGTMERRY